ncbi:MAG TPA: STELLO glycosyltransferase family protein [Blastocatellia bacterium]|nr:STELLO glycosyltransferase family protein [Blastocatellia bacterium]
MYERPLYCVITTIQEPTPSIQILSKVNRDFGSRIIIIGDKKGPSRFDLECGDFFPLNAQAQLNFRLAQILPTGHYARKNLGYLIAIQRGASCIYETDDDNEPAANWRPRSLTIEAQKIAPTPWVNVYRLFSDELIWPRGFPLSLIRDPNTYCIDRRTPAVTLNAPIQQGLSDSSPDVDAIWRLLFDHEFSFQPRPSVWLPPGSWCPFNSQSTWWWPIAYPLLYLPSFCSFRMTDVWRSFVAQRCLWELGYGLVFHPPEVIQRRNSHDNLQDFRDETPGYANNLQIVDLLTEADLQPGPNSVSDNLIRCYELLIRNGYIAKDESPLLNAWLEDLDGLSIKPI